MHTPVFFGGAAIVPAFSSKGHQSPLWWLQQPTQPGRTCPADSRKTRDSNPAPTGLAMAGSPLCGPASPSFDDGLISEVFSSTDIPEIR